MASTFVTCEAVEEDGVSERLLWVSIIEIIEFSSLLSLFLISSASERGFECADPFLSTFSAYVHDAALDSPLTMQF